MYSTEFDGDASASRLSRSVALALPAFATAIFVSAFLLFAVQPMFAKMVLPRLGGSPSVWSVAMCFFQAALLVGYAYAHLLTRHLPLTTAVTVHVGLSLFALAALPIGLAAGWDRPPLEYTAIWLIGLFAVSIGIPFVAVSANSPLLQAWFARTGHPHAADPYFLYGASNVGSLIALLSYPVLFEPFLRLQTQSLAWTAGYIVLIGLIAACGALAVASRPAEAVAAPEAHRSLEEDICWRQRLGWMGYAFIPSALLVALTAHISTDVAAAPFLWVVPLALFLLTFVITFARRQVLPHSLMLTLQAVLVLPLAVLATWGTVHAWGVFLVLNLIGFFVVAMVCHGELVRHRPSAMWLTGFYLWMSVGGVLGGIFTSLIAPHVFSTVVEYPLLLVASLLCRPGVFAMPLGRRLRDLRHRAVAYVKSPVRLAAIVLGISVLALYFHRALPVVETWRGFFGVHKVVLSQDGRFRLLYHGTTLHGAQRLFEADGTPAKALEPLTYYHDRSPLHDVIEATRQADGPRKVGLVGLGSGSLACWRQPGEDWRYFEIDPLVVGIARDSGYFSFLPQCGPDMPIVLGDARLTVADEPDGAYDLIVIDAFSSDSIPVHLMTREAIEMYFSKLAPNGVVAMHVSNRNLDLAPVLAASADAMGLSALVNTPVRPDPSGTSFKHASQVVVMAREAEAVAGIDALPGWQPLAPEAGMSEWTDDYSNILGAILSKWRGGASR